jgi:hypothetical protein
MSSKKEKKKNKVIKPHKEKYYIYPEKYNFHNIILPDKDIGVCKKINSLRVNTPPAFE